MTSKETKARFIYKPIEITQDKRLTPIEGDYLCLIAQLENNKGCTASNNFFADYFGVSRNAAINVIAKLKKKEFIKSEVLERRGEKITKRKLSIIDEVSKRCLLTSKGVGKQGLPTGVSNQQTSGLVTNGHLVSNQRCQYKTKYKTKVKTKEYSPNSDEFRLSRLLQDILLERKPDWKKQNLQKWAVHVNRMIRIDERSPKRIEVVIKWCQSDPFWQNNILSTNKLRDQFDRLEMQMEGKRNAGNNSSRQKQNRDFSSQKSKYGEQISVM